MPSLLRRGFALLLAPVNEVSFAVRSAVAWSRGAPRLPSEDKHDLFAALPAADRAQATARAGRLAERFDLGRLHAHSSRSVYAANLALLENLVTLAAGEPAPASADGCVRAVDVGSGDFHYATALQRWLACAATAGPRPVVLRGFELDGHGVYRDGHSRADHARAHAALADEAAGTVRYEVADVTRIRLPEQDVVTLLFPFLSAYPLLRWGLPLSRLRPRRVLRAAVAALRPGGWLAVANQTEAEFERLCRCLAEQPVDLVRRVSFATDLVPEAARTGDRVGSLWRRRFALPAGAGSR